MTIHDAPLCIQTDDLLAEELPAQWDVSTYYETCELYSFQIGGWTGTRDDAIAMTGLDHVVAQEKATLERIIEARDPLDDGDEAYDTWKESA